jgi:hypothetical protein
MDVDVSDSVSIFDDLEALRASGGTEVRQIKSPKPKKWRREFVRVPWEWAERLQKAKRVSTFKLAHLLLYQHWRTGGRPLVLSNVSVRAEGLSRWTKWLALAELEQLGLVRVERRKRQAPQLVLQHVGPVCR